MIVLKILFFLFLMALLLMMVVAIVVFSKLNDARKMFKDIHRDRQRNVDGQAVTDTRSPEQTHRKIVADDEGEYVEFEEVN